MEGLGSGEPRSPIQIAGKLMVIVIVAVASIVIVAVVFIVMLAFRHPVRMVMLNPIAIMAHPPV